MPLLVAAILGGLASVCASLVGRVLLALGISYVTYSGVTVATNWLVTSIKNATTSFPADIAQFISFCWIDKGLALIFSSFAAALVIRGATSSITKQVIKGR
jgi:Protein of unknown function (DUF2523)